MENRIYLPLHLDRFNWTYWKDDPNICDCLIIVFIIVYLRIGSSPWKWNSTWQSLRWGGRSVLQGRPACLGLGGVCHFCGIQGTYRHTITIIILWYVHLMRANQSNTHLCRGLLLTWQCFEYNTKFICYFPGVKHLFIVLVSWGWKMKNNSKQLCDTQHLGWHYLQMA